MTENCNSARAWVAVIYNEISPFIVSIETFRSHLELECSLKTKNANPDKLMDYCVINKIYLNDGDNCLKYIGSMLQKYRKHKRVFGEVITFNDSHSEFESKKKNYNDMIGKINYHFDHLKKQLPQTRQEFGVYVESHLQQFETGVVKIADLYPIFYSWFKTRSIEEDVPTEKELCEYMDMMFGPGNTASWRGVKFKSDPEKINIYIKFIEDHIILCESNFIKKNELNNEFSLWCASKKYGGRRHQTKDLHDYMDELFGARKHNCWSGVKIKYDNISLENQEDIGESVTDEVTLEDLDELR